MVSSRLHSLQRKRNKQYLINTETKNSSIINVYVLSSHIFLPVNSDPPVVVGGDQLRVTLLLVTFVARTFRGHEGGAKENLNYNLHNTSY